MRRGRDGIEARVSEGSHQTAPSLPARTSGPNTRGSRVLGELTLPRRAACSEEARPLVGASCSCGARGVGSREMTDRASVQPRVCWQPWNGCRWCFHTAWGSCCPLSCPAVSCPWPLGLQGLEGEGCLECLHPKPEPHEPARPVARRWSVWGRLVGLPSDARGAPGRQQGKDPVRGGRGPLGLVRVDWLHPVTCPWGPASSCSAPASARVLQRAARCLCRHAPLLWPGGRDQVKTGPCLPTGHGVPLGAEPGDRFHLDRRLVRLAVTALSRPRESPAGCSLQGPWQPDRSPAVEGWTQCRPARGPHAAPSTGLPSEKWAGCGA